MADFEQSELKTGTFEAGYSNDPSDAGGETWYGVSRRFHPEWPGWSIIDVEKNGGMINIVNLNSNATLQELVTKYYRKQYWNRFNGDAIPVQLIADELLDTSINMGVHRAVGFLQAALNLLNRNQLNYPDILEDGIFGPKTLDTLNQYLVHEQNDSAPLLKIMNILQGMHYIEYMRQHPEQERYARGWLKRT